MKKSVQINRGLLSGICAAILLAATGGAEAQQTERVSFAPGTSGTEITGSVQGDDYIDYVLGASAGQLMTVDLTVTETDGNGSIQFNILPARQDFGGPYIGSMDDDRAAGIILDRSGDWAIRVYLLGNDQDTDKTVDFAMAIGITEAPEVPPLLEEDFFVVALEPGGVATVRDAPGAAGEFLGQLWPDTVVRNTGGCVTMDGLQWCKVAAEGNPEGWVFARNLKLPR